MSETKITCNNVVIERALKDLDYVLLYTINS